MKPKNLISIIDGDSIIHSEKLQIDKKIKTLKEKEVEDYTCFYKEMTQHGCEINHFDGFFSGYTIRQISKEFDLLRFGKETVLNIEIKGKLEDSKIDEKVLKQMKQNYCYLNFLNKNLELYTYVREKGFYFYDIEKDKLEKVESEKVADSLKTQNIDYSLNPDEVFLPARYLISPFNCTDSFVNSHYFLTESQENIKKEILEKLNNSFEYFCISAGAGTGKTLLLYDIAKELIANKKNVLVIHCGKLNEGQIALNTKHKWNISSIKDIRRLELNSFNYILIDEAHRIRVNQLDSIIDISKENEIPIIFSYDVNQYLHADEKLNINDFITKKDDLKVKINCRELTRKIRTNKAMASFITNLFNINKSNNDLEYECITIEYMKDLDMLINYICFLEKEGWTPITYTPTQYGNSSYNYLRYFLDKKAHDVIGQEFQKVVLVMDNNFEYNESNELVAKENYYDGKGMLFQIVTRVVGELKIIVVNNPQQYSKLLDIKALGK